MQQLTPRQPESVSKRTAVEDPLSKGRGAKDAAPPECKNRAWSGANMVNFKKVKMDEKDL